MTIEFDKLTATVKVHSTYELNPSYELGYSASDQVFIGDSFVQINLVDDKKLNIVCYFNDKSTILGSTPESMKLLKTFFVVMLEYHRIRRFGAFMRDLDDSTLEWLKVSHSSIPDELRIAWTHTQMEWDALPVVVATGQTKIPDSHPTWHTMLNLYWLIAGVLMCNDDRTINAVKIFVKSQLAMLKLNGEMRQLDLMWQSIPD